MRRRGSADSNVSEVEPIATRRTIAVPVDPTEGADGDRQARFLSELATAYRRVYSCVSLCVASPSDADDVMQEVCLVLWRKFDEYDPGRNFGSWSCGIAYRVARDQARRRRRHRGLALSDETLAQLAAVQQGVGELIELREEILRDCLGKLRRDDREFVRRVYGDETTVVDIARETGRPVASLYTKLKRLRRRLFECVNRNLGRTGETR